MKTSNQYTSVLPWLPFLIGRNPPIINFLRFTWLCISNYYKKTAIPDLYNVLPDYVYINLLQEKCTYYTMF